MLDDRTSFTKSLFFAQAIFGAVALFLLGVASVWWHAKVALDFTVAACGAVIICQSFGMRSLYDAKLHRVTFAIWCVSMLLAVGALLSLPA